LFWYRTRFQPPKTTDRLRRRFLLTLSGKGAGGDQQIEARLSSGILGERHG
jgi:hypothetical protein